MYLIAPWNHSVARRRWQADRWNSRDAARPQWRRQLREWREPHQKMYESRWEERSAGDSFRSRRATSRRVASRRVALRSVPLRLPYLVPCVPTCIGPPHVARRDVALRSRRERRRGAPPPLQAATRLPRMPPLPRRRCASAATTRGAVLLSPAPAGVWCLRLQSHDGPCAALFHIPACVGVGTGEGWRRANLT